MIAVREGEPHEVDRAIAVWRESFVADRGDYVVPADYAAKLADRIGRGDVILVFADEGSEAVGMALGEQALENDGRGVPIPGLWHISIVAVLSSRWGQGIGKLVVDEMSAAAARRGYMRAQLWTEVRNQRSRALYAGRGFQHSGRTRVEEGREIMHLERLLLRTT
jgi:GNAT superfamily N-acetyltransferase